MELQKVPGSTFCRRVLLNRKSRFITNQRKAAARCFSLLDGGPTGDTLLCASPSYRKTYQTHAAKTGCVHFECANLLPDLLLHSKSSPTPLIAHKRGSEWRCYHRAARSLHKTSTLHLEKIDPVSNLLCHSYLRNYPIRSNCSRIGSGRPVREVRRERGR